MLRSRNFVRQCLSLIDYPEPAQAGDGLADARVRMGHQAITASRAIIPTTLVGNGASVAILANRVIVEINLARSLALEGLHDIFIPKHRPQREPVPVMTPSDRIGTTAIMIAPEKIAAIVVTDKSDRWSAILAADDGTAAIARARA